MSRTINEYLVLTLKGLAIGAADFVPGVSGAAAALITGIYKEIVDSIDKLNFNSLKVLFKKGFKAFWTEINGNFMISVTFGLIVGFFTFGRLFTYLYKNYPIFLLSFFFGVIVASSIYMLSEIHFKILKKDFKNWFIKLIPVLLGIAIPFLLSLLTPMSNIKEPSYWFVVICAILAALAMCLPGISVALVLVLLGQYEFISGSMSVLKMESVLVYFISFVVGFIIISKLISGLIKKYHYFTMALLTGLMIGSLYKLWPWKHTLLSYTNQYAQIIPIKQENVFPNAFYELTAKDPLFLYAILMALAGALVIYLLHNAFVRKKTENIEL